MSVEQWGILALVVLLPLLEGIARLRRARVNDDRPGGRVAQAPPSARRGIAPPSLPRLLPHSAVDPAVPPAPVRTIRTPQSKASPSPEAQRRAQRPLSGGVQRPLSGEGIVQWLRPTRNLRRAIVVATILGPPTQ